jgi:hypothetical protein
VLSTPSLSGRSMKGSTGKKTWVSQSAVPVFEEPIGATLAINELDFTGIRRGVHEGSQENDDKGERASENHDR